jgi:hypothetical protein
MKASHIEKRGWYRLIVLLLVLFFLLLGSAAIAADAETGKALQPGRFDVVAGKDDLAYLVDTSTGAVWVLTYRTLATGREPIAIPYKFILRTPKDQSDFLSESPTSISLPPSGGK